MKRNFVIWLFTIVVCISGCVGEKQVLKPLEEGKGKIKVLSSYDESSFYSEYGNYFAIKHPDIELEVISTAESYNSPDQDAAIQKIIDKHQPDVLLLNEKMFTTYAQDGKLYALDDIIAQEKFDLEGYMPGLIDMLRAKGNGTLYGLAPTVYAEVLYFNRDLFKEHNIEPPSNKMSWKQLFDLSRRFANSGSGDNNVYGLSPFYETVGDLLQMIAATSSLQLFDAKGEKLLLQSDAWKQAIQMATDAVRTKSFYAPKDKEYGLFSQGNVAMTWSGSSFPRYHLKQAKKPINWDIVTMPVNPASPDESSNVRLSEIYAVAQHSQNQRAAWEFVQFVNGLDMAKAKSRTGGSMSTRKQFFKEIDGRSTDPFYMLKPKESGSNWDIMRQAKVPSAWYYKSLKPLLDQTLQAIIDNKKTVDEAVAELQTSGQQMLDKARAEAQQEKEKGKEGTQ